MNRLGVLVDVSHVSDEAFDDVLEASAVPPIASHSSCRAFVPGFERNLDDERIARLGEAGGVLHINFGSAFLTAEANATAFAARANGGGTVALTTVADVADHIDHAVALAGVEHVGLGSDFDGVDDLPVGLQDVSRYPALIEELLRRGYSDDELRALLGGNLMRVWRAAEGYAAAHAR
jgi:membrane dipeptidase